MYQVLGPLRHKKTLVTTQIKDYPSVSSSFTSSYTTLPIHHHYNKEYLYQDLPAPTSASASPTFLSFSSSTSLNINIMPSKDDRDTLYHVLYTIFELDNTTPLVKILKVEGWDVLSFVTESDLAITTLNNADENIPSWQLEYINIFSQYFYYRQEYGEPLQNN